MLSPAAARAANASRTWLGVPAPSPRDAPSGSLALCASIIRAILDGSTCTDLSTRFHQKVSIWRRLFLPSRSIPCMARLAASGFPSGIVSRILSILRERIPLSACRSVWMYLDCISWPRSPRPSPASSSREIASILASAALIWLSTLPEKSLEPSSRLFCAPTSISLSETVPAGSGLLSTLLRASRNTAGSYCAALLVSLSNSTVLPSALAWSACFKRPCLNSSAANRSSCTPKFLPPSTVLPASNLSTTILPEFKIVELLRTVFTAAGAKEKPNPPASSPISWPYGLFGYNSCIRAAPEEAPSRANASPLRTAFGFSAIVRRTGCIVGLVASFIPAFRAPLYKAAAGPIFSPTTLSNWYCDLNSSGISLTLSGKSIPTARRLLRIFCDPRRGLTLAGPM